MLTRRRFLAALAAPAVAGCQGGPPTFLGYRLGADALYDEGVKTVYVRSFANRAFQTTPYRLMEVDITRAVVREIGKTTPFRVSSDIQNADTELIGVLVDITKTILNRNQQNAIREGEIAITVDVVWRDLRDGRILSNPRRPGPPPGLAADLPPFDPDAPLPPPLTEVPAVTPARLVAVGRLIPELGETNASASKLAVDRMAVQIVSLMEKPW